jgi:hypothetical protein
MGARGGAPGVCGGRGRRATGRGWSSRLGHAWGAVTRGREAAGVGELVAASSAGFPPPLTPRAPPGERRAENQVRSRSVGLRGGPLVDRSASRRPVLGWRHAHTRRRCPPRLQR